MEERSTTIGFRLDAEYRERLETAAARLHVPPATLVKRIITAHLDDAEGPSHQQELRKIEKGLGGLKTALRDLQEEVSLLSNQPVPKRKDPTVAPIVTALRAMQKELDQLRHQRPSAKPDPGATSALREVAQQLALLRRDLGQGLSGTHEQLAVLKANLWNAALAILVQGEPLTASQANQWAKERLRD